MSQKDIIFLRMAIHHLPAAAYHIVSIIPSFVTLSSSQLTLYFKYSFFAYPNTTVCTAAAAAPAAPAAHPPTASLSAQTPAAAHPQHTTAPAPAHTACTPRPAQAAHSPPCYTGPPRRAVQAHSRLAGAAADFRGNSRAGHRGRMTAGIEDGEGTNHGHVVGYSHVEVRGHVAGRSLLEGHSHVAGHSLEVGRSLGEGHSLEGAHRKADLGHVVRDHVVHGHVAHSVNHGHVVLDHTLVLVLVHMLHMLVLDHSQLEGRT